MEDYPGEVWKILEYPGLAPEEHYEISNYGRIKSYKVNKLNGKIIKGSYLKGYNIINVKLEGGKRKTLFMHKLVAEYYVDQESDLQKHVIHLDYSKSNNHFENLKWVTFQTFNAHHRLNPNYQAQKGLIRNAKLTEADVIRLKKKLRRGKYKLYKLAKEFGITHTQLNRIRSGENWSHVTIDDDDDE
ncbi:MAG: NUMOD4 domain-containing protein [Bacteroidales bacterium]|jgi:DNA-binding Xre family transcriptional regulator|nr:NUMOD4 domain-containing protein [Bacteroidales bacterium]